MTESKPRQLIICCDGTNNNLTGGDRDTHVVRLCQLLSRSPDDRQQVFYDPGVGNPGELPGATLWDRARRRTERVAGLAFGRGVYENMAECYQFLMQHHRPGDQIFVFGFSRGAFTARSVAGLVNLFGILQPHMVSMVPTLLHIYFSDRGASGERMQRIAAQVTSLFADAPARCVDIHFVGVWDTVASVGMPPFSRHFTARANVDGKRFLNVRQALALDEYRAQFAPRQYINPNGDYRSDSGRPITLRQLWFSGAHGDVGGGYAPDQLALADQAMAWLVSEATGCGLRLGQGSGQSLSEPEVLDLLYFPGGPERPDPDSALVHSELHRTPLWAVAGMSVRTPGEIRDVGGQTAVVPAQEHPSVARFDRRHPGHTVWRRRQSWWPLLGWMLAFVVLYGGVGQMLLTQEAFPRQEMLQDATIMLQRYPDYLMQNLAFVRWQTLWWFDGQTAAASPHLWEGLVAGLEAHRDFGSPRWSLVWDLGLILAYAQVLSRFCVAGFARGAGLRRVGQAPSRWLNRLGWALPLMVLSDVGENLCTWLTITLTGSGYVGLATLAGVAMTLLSMLKWAGLAGVLVLCGWPRRIGP